MSAKALPHRASQRLAGIRKRLNFPILSQMKVAHALMGHAFMCCKNEEIEPNKGIERGCQAFAGS